VSVCLSCDDIASARHHKRQAKCEEEPEEEPDNESSGQEAESDEASDPADASDSSDPFVEKGKDVAVSKGRKASTTKVMKGAQIDDTTVYLEDVQKPRYIPALHMVGALLI
jgi:hypothetical protein